MRGGGHHGVADLAQHRKGIVEHAQLFLHDLADLGRAEIHSLSGAAKKVSTSPTSTATSITTSSAETGCGMEKREPNFTTGASVMPTISAAATGSRMERPKSQRRDQREHAHQQRREQRGEAPQRRYARQRLRVGQGETVLGALGLVRPHHMLVHRLLGCRGWMPTPVREQSSMRNGLERAEKPAKRLLCGKFWGSCWALRRGRNCPPSTRPARRSPRIHPDD